MRRNPPILSVAVLVLGIGACSTKPSADNSSALNQSAAVEPAPSSATGGSTPAATAATESDSGLVVTSVPAAGSTVKGPIDALELNFSKAVALGEVLVTGPDGQMPMMLSPAGKQTHFSVPLPGLMSGHYSVSWKASLDGAPKSGSFAFTVK